MIQIFFAALLIALPSAALAQANSCIVPDVLPELRVDAPPPDEIRKVPVTGYLLSLSWSPQYCRDKQSSAADAGQCGKDARFGFILHGLWPEGDRQIDPAWCGEAKPLDAGLVKQHFCMTPSARLLQHEWAKHGTCMARYSPASYFERSNALYYGLRFPDMDGLSRRNLLTAGDLATAFAAANRGMTADMMRVTATREGWLDEIWICLNKAFRPARCPAHQGGLSSNASLKIWRGSR